MAADAAKIVLMIVCARIEAAWSIALAMALSSIAPLSAIAAAKELPTDLWPMYQYASDHNAAFNLPRWNVAWHATLGGRINGGLSIVGRMLYVESYDRRLYALDPLTGKELWRATLSNIAMNTPVVAAGLVYAGTGSSHVMSDSEAGNLWGSPGGDSVYAFRNDSGAFAWRYETIGEDMPTGTIVAAGARPAFVFSNGDGNARALSAGTGELLWQQKMLGVSTMSSLAVDGSTVFGLSNAASTFVMNAYTAHQSVHLARRAWTWALNSGNGQFIWTSPYGNSDCSPALGEGNVLIEGTQFGPPGLFVTEVDALDAHTGVLRWKYSSGPGPAESTGTNELATAGLYDGGLFFDSLQFVDQFAAFDASTGRVVWRIHTQGPVKMSAVEKDGYLYFGDVRGYLYVVHARDGKMLALTKFPEFFAAAPPVIVGGTLFVVNNATVYALRLADLQRGLIST